MVDADEGGASCESVAMDRYVWDHAEAMNVVVVVAQERVQATVERARGWLRARGEPRWTERHARDGERGLHEVSVRTDLRVAALVVWHPGAGCGCSEVEGRAVMPEMPPPWPMRKGRRPGAS